MYWYLVAIFYSLAGYPFKTILAEMAGAIAYQQTHEWYWARNYYDFPRL